MQYALNKGVCYRQIEQEFLVYSNYSRETLVIHQLAFDLLTLLETEQRDFESILCVLRSKHADMSVKEIHEFLDTTVKQFCQLGLIDCNEIGQRTNFMK